MKIKRLISVLLLLPLLGAVVDLYAQTTDNGRANECVVQLSQAVKALGVYAVRFTVTMGEHEAAGDYMVGDGRYTLRLGSVEVYGDAECRYEVDTSRREMVIDKVDKSSHNILNNPLSAFDFIGDEYHAEIISEEGNRVVVRLTPPETVGGAAVDVTLDRRTHLPKSLVYAPMDESVRVVIDQIGAVDAAPAKFDAARYKDFEVIDFR